MMTLIEEGRRFVHGPDIQLICDETVSLIQTWEPDILHAGGPPICLSRLTHQQLERCWGNALRLAQGIDAFILDHYFLRSMEGTVWLERLSAAAGKRIFCAADFMGETRRFMEAKRESLYCQFPVSEDWHEAYARGEVTTELYR